MNLLDGNIAIYGAGGIGKIVYDVLKRINKKAICFIDKNKYNIYHDGIPICNLENIDKYNIDLVIVGIFSHPKECDINYIEKTLKSVGIDNIISFEEFYQNFYNCFDENNFYWLAPTKCFSKDIDKINKAREIFYDDKSIDIFDGQIKHRLGESYKILQTPDYDTVQYLAKDIPINRENINFMDLGAYNGDTLTQFINDGVTFNKIIAFEPDINNYKKLSKNLAYLKENYNISEIFSFPVGTSNTIELALFNENGDASSGYSLSGKVNIPIITIDKIIYGFKPTYIKMDIEGFEMNTILGLKRTISQYRPSLAISVYHLPSDLYEIPLFFNENFENYDLFLRVYGSHCMDTILYAIPKEQSRAEQSRAEQSRAEQSIYNIWICLFKNGIVCVFIIVK